jgi:hypothetical protein
MARKKALDAVIAASDEVDAKAIEDIRAMSRQLGRAIGLSVIAATANASVEDHAIKKMDEAWTELADRIIMFALED